MNTQTGQKMFEQVQAANETAWKDMQTTNQKAFAELRKAGQKLYRGFNDAPAAVNGNFTRDR
jgi:hypothetical protein